MITRKLFRLSVLAALNNHDWFITRSIRAIDLDFSPEAEKDVEQDLRESEVGAVIMVSQILEGKKVDSARMGQRINREIVLGVVTLLNPERMSEISNDDLVDEAIKAVIGLQRGPGNRAFEYVSEKLEQHNGAIRTLIQFKTSTVIDSHNG